MLTLLQAAANRQKNFKISSLYTCKISTKLQINLYNRLIAIRKFGLHVIIGFNLKHRIYIRTLTLILHNTGGFFFTFPSSFTR